jgi:hypothetical protein
LTSRYETSIEVQYDRPAAESRFSSLELQPGISGAVSLADVSHFPKPQHTTNSAKNMPYPQKQ